MAFRLTHARTANRGFSLVELLVVTAVIVIVTSTVLSNHAKFGTTVVLERLAYDVGLNLRKAQTYGVSVFRTTSGTFATSYGVYINLTNSSTDFILFADSVTANSMYDNGETVELQSLLSGYRVERLCVMNTPPENCAITRLDIAFSRPDPDAIIHASGLSTQYSQGRIELRSPQGDLRSVIVEASGQIIIN